MSNPGDRSKSKLSAHIWDLKDKGINYEVKWKLLDRALVFNPITKKCRLSLNKKYMKQSYFYDIKKSYMKQLVGNQKKIELKNINLIS